MRRNVKSLVGFRTGATDGEFGKVDGFYFDDETWTIRYLVVKTSGWLFGRKVLISPAALQEPDWENQVFPVNLTKAQIENSPDIDTERTVSRQQEIDLYTHYDWPYMGIPGAGFYGGMGLSGMMESRIPFEENIMAAANKDKPVDPHLRSTGEVTGYRIHATNGEIGDVEDFIIDDQSWRMHFLVVDTGHWFPGKKVLIAPKWISEVKWEESAVYVNITVNAVKNSPEFDPSVPLPETYENEFYRYYGDYMND
ncbi:PRC-barrel domain-containing protein [Mucilaginibacter sp.]|uniref:PRC-barrel domain-containing protein n=1 Tax=Mucilaginibacter sp. TaxID=1882438 RepID=UPI00263016F5|nr:PRC-barrel domain-containing protein [Mucilaginibacter sp.]MDB4924437.1 PRC-barrel protein [Mucilaginibacter sp.]